VHGQFVERGVLFILLGQALGQFAHIAGVGEAHQVAAQPFELFQALGLGHDVEVGAFGYQHLGAIEQPQVTHFATVGRRMPLAISERLPRGESTVRMRSASA
jgi:hypothetical protein